MGGTNDPSNIVCLPPRAHFLAHYFLSKAYPKNRKLMHAFAMMFVVNPYQSRRMNSKLYEIAKAARSNALKGIPRPEWVKEKLRKPKPNKQNYLKPKSKQHSENISKALTGLPKPKIQCSHCKMMASPTNIKRWHNDNCKKRGGVTHPNIL
jgi:hypothetical protein